MFTLENSKKWLELFKETIDEKHSYLSELDTPIGDGDHGNNMKRGVTGVAEAIEKRNPETVADLFKVTAIALTSKVGGASGPLYGTAFLEMAKQKDFNDVYSVLKAGLEGIQKRGKAEPGQKTMVDLWHPALGLLKEGKLTPEKVDELVENTKDMKATKGRASYVGERSIGHIDPGAMSSGYLFKALIKAGILDE